MDDSKNQYRMKIRFTIHFNTIFGQQLLIIGSIPELGNLEIKKAKKMTYSDNGFWYAEINLPKKHTCIRYHYVLESNHFFFHEKNFSPRCLTISSDNSSYYLLDYWQSIRKYTVFSSAFSKNWFARFAETSSSPQQRHNLQINVSAPSVMPDECLAIVGNHETIGNWDPQKSLPMCCKKFPNWKIELDSRAFPYVLEYKFCVLETKRHMFLRWEEGVNRQIILSKLRKNEYRIVSDFPLREELKWKCAGTAIPIFSLKSKTSFGIGDFEDLRKMIDWAKLTGQKIIQILPINDTTLTHTWQDSYPYNAISVYALHPLYLHLPFLGKLCNHKRETYYNQKQKEFNTSSVVDYEKVETLKWKFFREIFQQEGEKVLSSKEFALFFEQNKEWLIPYTDYSYRRDTQGIQSKFTSIEKKIFKKKKHGIYAYLQFHAHKQLSSAGAYARKNRIVLKGDIPIGINRNGVEAYTEPHYFHQEFQVGAPPDNFSADGQIWGFPSYNWQEMEKDGFFWWKKRVKKIADYFDACRIDHILGFFRIWQVSAKSTTGLVGTFCPALPLSEEEIESRGIPWNRRTQTLFIQDSIQTKRYHPKISINQETSYQILTSSQQKAFYTLQHEYFYRRHLNLWKTIGLKHLTPLINSSELLICGEDLGMIPSSVPEVMKELQILSLEIERMPKSSEESFTNWQKVPYLSVCTTSTHDMATLREWWKEDKDRIRQYFYQVLKKGEKDSIPIPKECTPNIAESILLNHLRANSMLTIIPLQDWLAMDGKLRRTNEKEERINIPSNANHKWQYRMHLTIEDLLKAESFNEKIRSLLLCSKRLHP